MKKQLPAVLLIAFALTLSFCTNKNKTSSLPQQSHGKLAAPNYSLIFPNDKVNRIDIKIDKKQWAALNTDLETNLNSGHQRPERPAGAEIDNEQAPRNHQHMPPQGERFARRPGMVADSTGHQAHKKVGRRPGPSPVGGFRETTVYEPIWTYCTISFNNEQWDKVGIRFKGNSSLQSTLQMGIKKFSFKLDFDQYENDFPEIKNQRFYGFKQLNLKNNYDDPSFMREKVAADLFAKFGLTTPKTSFCQVFVDSGSGPQYFGLYTLVEEVDDTVIKTHYEAQKGNIYKPENIASTFAAGSFDEVSMNKKNNKKSEDFADVKKLHTILNSSLRTENSELWKTQLSQVFDVDIFIKWLAANTVMQNWDTYGIMPHNYYLYHNTTTDKLEWIPWDNNEALQHGKMGGSLSLSLNEVDNNWPLIRYIIDDEEWAATYKTYLSDFTEHVFTPKKMTAVYNKYQKLLSAHVIGDNGEQKQYSFLRNDSEFYEAVDFLRNHVDERNLSVQVFSENKNLTTMSEQMATYVE